ncbi:MAG: SdrD B-like domain-containing protein, partial [Candidatus Hodarchaeota archaeon]
MEQKKLAARIIGIGLVALLLLPITTVAAYEGPPLSGAIFTTTVDGSIVNENVHYQNKRDVYLDGGPGPNAPSTAAALPEGDYYFQVTDPSGKDLLSTDHISCRMIHINADGVIDFVYPGTNYYYQNGNNGGWQTEDCQHEQGVDVDHSELGAITVQLFPYDDTPNKGGVYKVWITPIDAYAPINIFDPTGEKNQPLNNEGYAPGNFHGFIPRWSKTDNFKVKKRPFVPPEITVRKFHDENANGTWDEGEVEIIGWEVDYTDPLGLSDTLYTPDTILAAEPGTYTFVEDTPSGTLQTVSILDGGIVSIYPNADPTVVVEVAGDSGETHEVIYGDIGLGWIEACKIYDRDGDGDADPDEPGIAGWKMELTGTDVTGAPVSIVQTTEIDGCTTFTDLLPGTYTVTELPPLGNWVATGPTSYTVTIISSLDGANLSGTTAMFTFTNFCEGVADFDTKGYWHNKNGLTELTQDDIDYANSLLPYSTESSYFGDGDEPFNGTFADGFTPVDAAIGD